MVSAFSSLKNLRRGEGLSPIGSMEFLSPQLGLEAKINPLEQLSGLQQTGHPFFPTLDICKIKKMGAVMEYRH